MKMPSTPVLFGIGAAVVVVLVVISKLHSSAPTAATTAATPTGSATGVDVGQLSSFESSLTSQLDAWEAQQAAGSSSTATTTPTTTTTSPAPSSPIPSSGTTPASNPAPVVASAKSSINLRTLGTLESEAELAGLSGSLQANDLNPAYIVASERQAAKQGISLAQAYNEEVTNTVPGYA